MVQPAGEAQSNVLRLDFDRRLKREFHGSSVTSAASSSQMRRLEAEWLAKDENLAALSGLSGQRIDRVHGRRLPRSIVLDMDSSVSPTHGDQEGTAYNGHFACTCDHPLFVFNEFGDLKRCALRSGPNGADASSPREQRVRMTREGARSMDQTSTWVSCTVETAAETVSADHGFSLNRQNDRFRLVPEGHLGNVAHRIALLLDGLGPLSIGGRPWPLNRYASTMVPCTSA